MQLHYLHGQDFKQDCLITGSGPQRLNMHITKEQRVSNSTRRHCPFRFQTWSRSCPRLMWRFPPENRQSVKWLSLQRNLLRNSGIFHHFITRNHEPCSLSLTGYLQMLKQRKLNGVKHLLCVKGYATVFVCCILSIHSTADIYQQHNIEYQQYREYIINPHSLID